MADIKPSYNVLTGRWEGKTKKTDSLKELMTKLRANRNALEDAMKAINLDQGLSDQGKASARQKLRTQHEDSIKLTAKVLWTQTGKALEDARKERATLVNKQQSWDYNKLTWLGEEIRTKIGSDRSGVFGGGAMQKARELHEHYTSTQDWYGLKALRHVVQPMLDTVSPSAGTDFQHAGALRAAFRQDEIGEQPEGLAELETEIWELDRMVKTVRLEVLTTEEKLTGQPMPVSGGPFGSRITPWGAEILGEGKAQAGSDRDVLSSIQAARGGSSPLGVPVTDKQAS